MRLFSFIFGKPKTKEEPKKPAFEPKVKTSSFTTKKVKADCQNCCYKRSITGSFFECAKGFPEECLAPEPESPRSISELGRVSTAITFDERDFDEEITLPLLLANNLMDELKSHEWILHLKEDLDIVIYDREVLYKVMVYIASETVYDGGDYKVFMDSVATKMSKDKDLMRYIGKKYGLCKKVFYLEE